jgi:hypothetical protein
MAQVAWCGDAGGYTKRRRVMVPWAMSPPRHKASRSPNAEVVQSVVTGEGNGHDEVVVCQPCRAVVAGVFLVDAAVSFNPQKAQGIDGSLLKLATTPLGPGLLVAVALGLVIFGVYSGCEARFRQVKPG